MVASSALPTHPPLASKPPETTAASLVLYLQSLAWDLAQGELSMSFFFLCIYLWLRWVFHCYTGFSLAAVSRGYSLFIVAVHRLLIAVASLIVEHRLQGAGSAVAANGLCCATACGIFPDQGSNPCPLHWQVDSLPLSHQTSLPSVSFFG